MLCAGVTVYKGLKVTDTKPGDWVVISGIGGLGHMAVQYAKAMGLNVAAVDIDDDKLALARQLGATLTVNALEDDPAAVDQARDRRRRPGRARHRGRPRPSSRRSAWSAAAAPCRSTACRRATSRSHLRHGAERDHRARLDRRHPARPAGGSTSPATARSRRPSPRRGSRTSTTSSRGCTRARSRAASSSTWRPDRWPRRSSTRSAPPRRRSLSSPRSSPTTARCSSTSRAAAATAPRPCATRAAISLIADTDVLLGHIGEAPVYIGGPQYAAWKHTDLVIDAVPGRGGMFSLDNGRERRFLTRSHVCSLPR